ncbi:hypothetical protein IGL98_003073 [Enterococcus sp. DIV0840]|uniref:DNA-binding protein n=1 Tax=Enterococcus TaxID=1350 RepID=UPI001A8EA9C4|nr:MULTISPECIES: DNA-binding protein [Enterococcus]MBO0435995.1 DNA-binding protein [Enterococcus sp. DIV0849a]MBO0473047.1 DNA-binding protein [Enterococcus ureasiticus]
MTKLPNIGKPATNALHSIGITTLEQISLLDRANLSKLHGIGSKAISILEKSLAEHKLFFQDSPKDVSLPKSDFTVLCSLNCDNAPKRRMIRDCIVAAASRNQYLLESMLSDSFRCIIPNKKAIEDKNTFIELILKETIEIGFLEIQSILTHGNEGSAHGIITTKAGAKIYFSIIIRFKSNQKDAQISEITSFLIQ